MFLTGLNTKVTGFTAREAESKYSPEGVMITTVVLGVGDGSVRFPLMWVAVPVWDKLAEEALEVIDRKGIAIEASGMLQIRQYEGRHGKTVGIVLKNVRELKIYDRNGDLEKVLSGGEAEVRTEVENG